jgi:hypothetical protein
MKAGRTRIGALVAMVAVFASLTSLARAELTADGDLFVRFDGGIDPNALPRHTRVPVAVRLTGTVRTLSGAEPPALRQITIAINQGGHLDTHGLPVCHRGQLEPASSGEALAACAPALVGGGRYVADIALPEQGAFASRGRVLAFNAVVDGKRAILAHTYDTEPIPISRVIVFHIRQGGGAYGTVLTGSLPERLNRWGYLKRISLNLHRDFTYRGRRHSYLSAACAAPSGFPSTVFPFAHASMTFADGRTLSSTLTRSCKVRG